MTQALGAKAGRLQIAAALVGIAALAVCLASAWWDSRRFFEAYLLAYFFWIGLPLGSLALVMLHHLTGGRWGNPSRYLFEAAAATLPMIAVGVLPLLLGVRFLYPWAQPDALHDPLLQHKAPYLNQPFFIARGLLYVLVWTVLAHVLLRASARNHGAQTPPCSPTTRRISAIGLILYVMTISFAAIDWTMSLDPHWYSTIYGMIVIVGHALTALAAVILTLWALGVAAQLQSESRDHPSTGRETLADLGGLLLAFVVLWAYLSFSQYLLMWAGNLPEEVVWYQVRRAGGWGTVAVAMIVLQFFLPFALLLSRDIKRRATPLAAVAALVLAAHLLNVFWFIVPSLLSSPPLSWRQPLALLALGGLWLALYIAQIRRRWLPAVANNPESRP